ncbi:hypothetical protein [Legionella maioricensis]|uniref:Uncharacterized protein n=1 Tax=Legionella maioricensis TaxID=2896528 RepID=A0A9X2D1U1_9GAMM|nr:hypothetical protein [Legionella maioricensis]MCL9684853.1 hypothetical protein [Legionella maioricensis]MCL9688533.1 hypothetical protein [Legionella maioricensis]
MPHFLKNNPNFVLLDVQRGKRYVGDPLVRLPQAAQKGNSCALYAFNPLRFRFGKKYQANSKERYIELIFSDYRRGINEIDANVTGIYKLISEEISEFLQEPITAEGIKKYLVELENNLKTIKRLSTNTSELESQIVKYQQLCNDFLSHKEEYGDFDEFILQQEYVNWINLAQKTMKRLSPFTHLQADEVLENHINTTLKSVVNSKDGYSELLNLTRDNPQFMAPIYHQAIVNLAASCYELEGSNWEPTMPLEALMETLRQCGPQIIYTEPCVLFNKTSCQIETATEAYQIYSKKEDDSEEATNGCHSLLIIGAEMSDKGSFVYLIDPNLPDPLTGPRPIYKISYDELLSKILNIYGVSLNEDAEKVTGPFAFQAPKGHFDKLYDFVTGTSLDTYPKNENDETDIDHKRCPSLSQETTKRIKLE